VDLIEKKQWSKDLDRIYKNLASNSSGASTDDVLLEKITRETLQWAKARAETKDGHCELSPSL
jgi:hypothetical protein